MKKITVILFLFLFSLPIFTQVIVDGVDINTKEDLIYIRVIERYRGWGNNKIVINLDYGQASDMRRMRSNSIEIGPQKETQWNTIITLINLLENNGWEMMETQMNPHPSKETNIFDTTNYYYFRRKR